MKKYTKLSTKITDISMATDTIGYDITTFSMAISSETLDIRPALL